VTGWQFSTGSRLADKEAAMRSCASLRGAALAFFGVAGAAENSAKIPISTLLAKLVLIDQCNRQNIY
jgi:hypothetical protein